MSLESEVHQKEFRNEYHKAFVNIIHTHNYIVSRANNAYKKYDITRQQYNVLRILKGQYPGYASVFLIRERMLDKMSDASRIVERLRLKGLVSREFGVKDKRSVEVTITDKGLKLLEAMQAEVYGLESILRHIGTEEINQLNDLLDKIRIENPNPTK